MVTRLLLASIDETKFRWKKGARVDQDANLSWTDDELETTARSRLWIFLPKGSRSFIIRTGEFQKQIPRGNSSSRHMNRMDCHKILACSSEKGWQTLKIAGGKVPKFVLQITFTDKLSGFKSFRSHKVSTLNFGFKISGDTNWEGVLISDLFTCV